MHVKNLLAGMVLGIAGLLGQAQAIELQPAPSPLIELQLQSTRGNYALGEIVELELVVRDLGPGATPVQPPNPYFGNVQLFISSDGAHYREYTGPQWGSVHARQQARTLAPGEELRLAIPVLYNHRMPVEDLRPMYADAIRQRNLDPGFAFMEPGRYWAKVAIRSLGQRFESVPLQLDLQAPVGADAGVWQRVKHDPSMAYFLHTGQIKFRPGSARERQFISAVKSLSEADPQSTLIQQFTAKALRLGVIDAPQASQ